MRDAAVATQIATVRPDVSDSGALDSQGSAQRPNSTRTQQLTGVELGTFKPLPVRRCSPQVTATQSDVRIGSSRYAVVRVHRASAGPAVYPAVYPDVRESVDRLVRPVELLAGARAPLLACRFAAPV